MATLLEIEGEGRFLTSAIESGATVVKIKKPANVDPYATVVKLAFKGEAGK